MRLQGLWIFAFRLLFAIGYLRATTSRTWGGPFHFGELYCVITAARLAYSLIQSA